MTRPAASSPTISTGSSRTSRGNCATRRTSNPTPDNFLNAAMAGIGDGAQRRRPDLGDLRRRRGRAREMGSAAPPNVDTRNGFFFSADTLAELAGKIRMKYQRVPMPPAKLRRDGRALQFIRRYRRGHGFRQAEAALQDRQAAVLCRVVDAGDPRHARGPAHQRRMPGHGHEGQVIPGLYCGGESAGGFSQHGLARCIMPGLHRGP